MKRHLHSYTTPHYRVECGREECEVVSITGVVDRTTCKACLRRYAARLQRTIDRIAEHYQGLA